MIPVTLLNVHIENDTPIDFGANPGSSIRGALYETLRIMYDDGTGTHSHTDDRNVVAWLLRLEDEATSGGKDVPRPIAIRPPLQNQVYRSSFGLALFGQAQTHLALILSAVSGMREIGVGVGRRHFRVIGIDLLDPLTFQPYPLAQMASVPVVSKSAYQAFAQALDSFSLEVEFLTPTRIVQDGKLCRHPEFNVWVQRLLERIRLLSELYIHEPIEIPFHELLQIAQTIQIKEDQTQWQESWSGSRRDDKMRPTSGFIGRVTYVGNLTHLLPYLLLGQVLQVGKNIVKGHGWYRIHYRWRV